MKVALGDERPVFAVELGLPFDPDAGVIGPCDTPVRDGHAVSETPNGCEHAGIGFVTAEPEPCSHVQRELMAAVRDAPSWRPPELAQHSEHAKVLDTSVCK